ncbi:hypothetical protein F4775DRAFT_586355 [Biscogniauxia sp. FL1348]|nr:hypothetical protein F4775DRAFT_586355 [Biscogniauxia sp. FL1348]
MAYHKLFMLLAYACFSCTTVIAQETPTCFPYGSASLPKDLSPPATSLKDWWCPQSMAYGFQGFSYPLETADCDDPSNQFAAMNKDFAQMKQDFGASIVRMYYPTCLSSSVFEHALEAGVANDMAVIFQVWTDFGNSDEWKQSQQAIYDVLESSKYGPIAPYVVHSADFGSEPVGDNMDGGGEQFVADLGSFKEKLNSYGIPAGISEDWNRPGILSGADGTGLAEVGAGVKANSDYVHAHIMPYYQNDIPESGTWDYIQQQLSWVLDTVQLPTMITETQWAWGTNDHNPSRGDVGVSQYTQYWEKFDQECETFKQLEVGWFLHAWYGESTFDILYDNGSYVIPNFRPQKC